MFTDLLAFDYVDIQKPTLAQDSSGGSTRLPFVEKKQVPARVEVLTSSQQLRFSQPEIPVTHRVFLDDVTLVANGYILVTSDNLTLRVVGIEQQRGSCGDIDSYAAVMCEQVLI